MDEVEGHPGRGPDEILEPLHESGERTQLHDAEMGLGARGHRLDASPGGTQEQELLDYLRCMPTPILVEDKDRKSTRLNSSHSQISYAVFCLKKKKTRRSETYNDDTG